MSPRAEPRIDRPPRRAPRRSGARVERWCRAAAFAAAGLGYLAAFLALRQTAGGGQLGAWAPCALALMAIPPLESLFARDPTIGARQRRLLEGAAIALRLVLCVFLCAAVRRPEHALPAVLLLVRSAVLARAAHDAAAALSIAVALLQAGLAAVAARGAPSLLLLALSLALSMVAAVLLHARASRRRVLRATVHRLRVPDETAGRLGRRVAYGAGVALLVGFLAVVLDGAVQATGGGPRLARRSSGDRGAMSGKEALGSSPETSGGPNRFPRELELGASFDPLGADRILEVSLHGLSGEELGDRGELLLEGLHLDRFTERGLDLALDGPPELVRDGDDGREDGWILLEVPTGPASELSIVRVTQGALELGPAGEAPIFRPEPAFGLALGEALASPSGWMSASGRAGSLRYAVASALRAADLGGLAGAAARHPDARYVGLPPESEDLAFARALAREICAGAADGAARVAAVLSSFRSGFRYSFEPAGLPGVAGLRDFLERRSGSCAFFASAAVLLLRLEGVPARVSIGYRCREWSAAERRYIVRERDGHAWIEVHFEGRGWQTFDPTPPAALDAAIDEAIRAAIAAAQGAPSTAEPERGLSPWRDELGAALSAWLDPADEAGSPSAVVRALRGLPGALFASARASPLAAAALALAPALLLAWLLRRRLARALERAGIRVPGEPHSSFYWHRVLRALARRGLVKRPGQTPHELARAAIARDGPELEPLERLVELYYRDRFGGAPLGAGERRLVEELAARLGG